MKQGPVVDSCYDHLGGRLAERLARRLLELGWIMSEPNPGITPLGWAGFAQMGIDLGPLTGSRRHPITFCCGRPSDGALGHLGAHLGFLIQRHFVTSGWLRGPADQPELTPAGEAALQRLGVSLEDMM